MMTRAWLYGVSDLDNDYLAVDLPRWGDCHFGASWVRLGIDGPLLRGHAEPGRGRASCPFLRGPVASA